MLDGLQISMKKVKQYSIKKKTGDYLCNTGGDIDDLGKKVGFTGDREGKPES